MMTAIRRLANRSSCLFLLAIAIVCVAFGFFLPKEEDNGLRLLSQWRRSRREPQLTDGSACSKCKGFRSDTILKGSAEPSVKGDQVEKVKLLVIVKSAPQYTERRVKVRRNWLGQYSVREAWTHGQQKGAQLGEPAGIPVHLSESLIIYVAAYFVVGRSKDPAVRRRVAKEQEQHGDVYEADPIDDYETMTSKTQWTLMWSLKQDYTYLAHVDDDAVLIFSNFLPWLAEQPRQKFYAGHQHLWLGVKRCDTPEQIKKNCVPPAAYPVRPGHDDYPPFASGFAYVISRDAAASAPQHALAHLSTPGLPGNVEDAMLGVLLDEADIHLKNVKEFYHWQHDGGRCPASYKLLVLGNAPDYVLDYIARNEKNKQPLCTGL